MDPLTPLTLLPIMCKCMYRKNRQETSHMQHCFKQGISKFLALNDLQIVKKIKKLVSGFL